MKMNYRRADERRSPRRFGWSLVILILFLSGIFFWGAKLSTWFYGPVALVSRPFLAVGKVTVDLATDLKQFVRFKKSLVAENQKLKLENLRLKNIWQSNQTISQENLELKKIVGLNSRSEKPLLLAVTARPIITPHDILIVSLSDDQNHLIKVGDLVTTGGGQVLLGRVAEIYRSSAKIKLFTSFGDQVIVAIGPKSIPAIAKGLGSGNFSLSLPRGTEIAVGDSVFANSYRNLLLGSVGAIEAKSSDPYIRVLFRLPINLYELKWVEIYEN